MFLTKSSKTKSSPTKKDNSKVRSGFKNCKNFSIEEIEEAGGSKASEIGSNIESVDNKENKESNKENKDTKLDNDSTTNRKDTKVEEESEDEDEMINRRNRLFELKNVIINLITYSNNIEQLKSKTLTLRCQY